MKRVFEAFCRISFAVMCCVVILHEGMPLLSDYVYSRALKDDYPINKVKDTIKALQDNPESKYCSSSAVKYKGKIYTVTNRHCCEARKLYDNKWRDVGGRFEKILYTSLHNDVCILTSSSKKYIKLAKKPVKRFQKVLVMGHPLGEKLTARFGHVVSTLQKTCVNYENEGILCKKSIVSTVLILPGNSGSPLVNMKGELVGLVYAGNRYSSLSISVPLKYVRFALEGARLEREQ